MACQDNFKFKGVKHFGEAQFTNQLESSLKFYLDWAILSIGGWTNIESPTSGVYGGDFSRLRSSSDMSYTSGTVWEGVRKDWVWETGVNYEDGGTTYNPNQVTGITISGNSYGTGSFYVDYPNGRIVLNSAIKTTSTVKAEYSYRNVQVYVADQAPWWDEVQKGSLRVDNPQFLTKNSGEWHIGPHHRIQLPAIVIESVPRGYSKGYQQGDGSLKTYQEVDIHVLSEDRYYRNNILDWIRSEQDRTIYLVDTNRMYRETGYPLDYRGMVRENAVMYPNLVQTSGDGGFRSNYVGQGKCTFDSVQISDIETLNPNLYIGTAKCRMNAVLPDV